MSHYFRHRLMKAERVPPGYADRKPDGQDPELGKLQDTLAKGKDPTLFGDGKPPPEDAESYVSDGLGQHVPYDRTGQVPMKG